MGDRGNIVIRFDSNTTPKDIYLYTHWKGRQIGKILAKVLSRKERWNDPSYLARIIFQTMLNRDEGENGFGIAPYLCDNEHPLLIVDTENQQVYYSKEATPNIAIKNKKWSFSEFVDEIYDKA